MKLNEEKTLKEISLFIEENIEKLYFQRKLSMRVGREDTVNSQYWKYDKYYFLYIDFFKHSMQNMGTYEISDIENRIITKGMKLIDELLKKTDTKKYSHYMDTFSGSEYEVYCLHELEKYGWNTKLTKGGGDFGADLIAEKNKKRVTMQCKRHKSRIGISAIKEIFAANAYYAGDIGVVCSNMDYSKPARDFAQKINVVLIHHNQLKSLAMLI